MYTEARLYWKSHLDGANVGYLDQHVAWIDSSRHIPCEEWASYSNPPIDWCDMETWHTMWRP